MCGLVMLVTKNKNGFSQPQQNIFNTLFYLSGGFRGQDGAGVFVVDNLGNVSLAKDALRVHNFLNTKEFTELESLAYKDGWAMVAHNRAATRGGVSDVYSHPFVIDDQIVLVHNGTFVGSHKHIKDTDVDSEAIGHALLEEKDIGAALKKINAAYALMWYNIENKKLHVIRNDSRPLWYMELPDCYVYASEEIFLKFAVEKFGLKPLADPFEIAAHNLGTYTLLEDGYDTDNVDIDCKYEYSQEEYGEGWWNRYAHQGGNHQQYDYGKSIFEEVAEYYKDKLPMIRHVDWALLRDKYAKYTVIIVEPDDWTFGHVNHGAAL